MSDNADTNDWWEELKVKGQPVYMQIDSGAARSLMPYEEFIKPETKQPIFESDRQFKSYTKHPIKTEGRVILPTSYKGGPVDVQYYIVHTDKVTLLAGNPSKQLGLIKRIHAIEEIDRYPELKQTTATLPGMYSLKIDPTVKPVVHGPRCHSLALLQKIKSKLGEIEQAGHISKVTEPTDWVSSLVVVVKGEKIRLCIDPKDINRAIRWEHYAIPTVEEVVASIPRAKVFSVLDAKSGFLQIHLVVSVWYLIKLSPAAHMFCGL